MGTREGSQVWMGLGDRDLMPGPADRDPKPGQPAHLGQPRAAGQHDPSLP